MRPLSTLVTRMAALALAALSAGCGVLAEDVRPGDYVSARFQLTWSTEDAATKGVRSCILAGADSVRVRSRNLDTGDVFVDLFDCAVEAGLTGAVTAGRYAVGAELVACREDPECEREPAIADAGDPIAIEVFEEGDHDLGHLVFEVGRPPD